MDKKEKKQKNKKSSIILIILYALFVGVSFIFRFKAGIKIGENFGFFALDIIKMLPAAYILVGLFIVWIDRETVERFFGESSGFKGHIAAILLAGTTIYPFLVVLPMAVALAKKGARLSNILTFLGASAVCRIPMTIFEASFIGIKFTVIRYVVSLPLIVFGAIIMEKIIGKKYLKELYTGAEE